MLTGWTVVPLSWSVDLEHGGRWTSLGTATREWLWRRPDASVQAARSAVLPSEAFVDAGGGEECMPTVRGEPDHGAAWSRPWSGSADLAWVDLDGVGRLTRWISGDPASPAAMAAGDRNPVGSVDVTYEVTGTPGTRFLHAVHLLLDVSPAAHNEVPGIDRVRDLDATDGEADLIWPSGLDRLGPDDGSAACYLLSDCRRATVVDGDEALVLEWDAPAAPHLCSLLLWRNLCGWPPDAPYRSIGIEPLLGRAADLAADAGDCVVLGPAGRLHWRLRFTALRRAGQ